VLDRSTLIAGTFGEGMSFTSYAEFAAARRSEAAVPKSEAEARAGGRVKPMLHAALGWGAEHWTVASLGKCCRFSAASDQARA
jgi:hypothetical protein